MTNSIVESIQLEASGVCFSYSRPVVTDVSLELLAGSITGIIGPNGSGKTTILRLLDGILRPSAGQVRLHNKVLLSDMSRKEIARHIAMVPQNGGLHYYQTVFNFTMQGRSPHLSLLAFESDRDEEIVREVLDMTHMTHLWSSRISDISGGEKQRLQLARALAQQAEILLLDEFTANLDINYQVELMRLVHRITRQRRIATLVVSHAINLLSAFCDGIILMGDGSIRHQGSPREVLTRENLNELFGLDFVVRQASTGIAEVLPIMDKG